MLLSLIYVSLASISPVIPRMRMSSERQNAQKRRAQSFLSKRRCSSSASEDKATSDSSQGPPPALFRFASKFSPWGPCGGALCGFHHMRRAWVLLLCNEREARFMQLVHVDAASDGDASTTYQPVSGVPQCPHVIAGTLQRRSACLLLFFDTEKCNLGLDVRVKR